ncbi:hypothetical protein D1007_15395 [Hordeum vulgare]|nr:hypothetical protein D1007_15395 [Hordeum vulgare]
MIERENDGDEKTPDEKAMLDLFGLKTESNERATELGPIVIPTPVGEAGLDDIKDAAIVIDDKAPTEPLTAWDERNRAMDIGTSYPNMVEFRKALK